MSKMQETDDKSVVVTFVPHVEKVCAYVLSGPWTKLTPKHNLVIKQTVCHRAAIYMEFRTNLDMLENPGGDISSHFFLW